MISVRCLIVISANWRYDTKRNSCAATSWSPTSKVSHARRPENSTVLKRLSLSNGESKSCKLGTAKRFPLSNSSLATCASPTMSSRICTEQLSKNRKTSAVSNVASSNCNRSLQQPRNSEGRAVALPLINNRPQMKREACSERISCCLANCVPSNNVWRNS